LPLLGAAVDAHIRSSFSFPNKRIGSNLPIGEAILCQSSLVFSVNILNPHGTHASNQHRAGPRKSYVEKFDSPNDLRQSTGVWRCIVNMDRFIGSFQCRVMTVLSTAQLPLKHWGIHGRTLFRRDCLNTPAVRTGDGMNRNIRTSERCVGRSCWICINIF
jgi:hypothetical protein